MHEVEGNLTERNASLDPRKWRSQPKREKSEAKPRSQSGAVPRKALLCWIFGWTRPVMTWGPPALRMTTDSRSPSLEAKYRGLWKTCQEKNSTRPQNVRIIVSKPSTG